MTLLAITIDIDPYIVTIAGVTISWLAIFIFAGISVGSWLALREARRAGLDLDSDTASNLVFVIVLSGIVGARLLYVIERYGDSSSLDSPLDILALNEGGISIYGSLIGGAMGGWAYGLARRLPSAALADCAAFGMLAGIGVGRIGDVINGEHLSKPTDLPWAVVYAHPDSPGYLEGAMHPVVAYEVVIALGILGVLMWLRRFGLKDGVIFAAAFLLYGITRFATSFLRIDSKEPVLGLSTPQVVSLLVIPVALALLVWFSTRPRTLRPAAGS